MMSERDCLRTVAYALAHVLAHFPISDFSTLHACQFLMGLRGRAPFDRNYRDSIVWC